MNAPQLISIVPAPSSLKWAYIAEDGDLAFHDVQFIGFSNNEKADWIAGGDRPVTKTWYSKYSYIMWFPEGEHRFTKTRSGQCMCGDLDCRDLGVVDCESQKDMDGLSERADVRRAWLSKRENRRVKAKAYALAHKGATASKQKDDERLIAWAKGEIEDPVLDGLSRR